MRLLVVSLIGLGCAASTALADEVPTYDSAAYCAAIAAIAGNTDVVRQSCLGAEATHQRRLQAVWAMTPEKAKRLCLQTTALAKPSYQALGGCLSLNVGVMWLNGEVMLTPK